MKRLMITGLTIIFMLVVGLQWAEKIVAAQTGPPLVLFVSPDNGPADGGTEVKIAGANFLPDTKVIWAGQMIPVTFIDSGFLMIKTPFNGPGKISIKVINPDGGSGDLPDGFTYEGQLPAPKVKLLAPTGGDTLSAGGEAILINWQIESDSLTNQRLLLSTDGGATFPIVISDNLNNSTRKYLWLIPAELASENARVRLEAAALESIGNGDSDDLKLIRAPQISSLSPATIRANGSTFQLTINGAGFAKGSVVEIDNQRVKAKQVTANSIQLSNVSTPSPGAHFIRIRNRNRTVSSKYLFTVAQ